MGDEDLAKANDKKVPSLNKQHPPKSPAEAGEEDDEWKDSESEGEKDDDDNNEDEDEEDLAEQLYLGGTTLELRHLSLREYLRDPASKRTLLTTTTFDAQVDLTITCLGILCSNTDDPKYDSKINLEAYATCWWPNHLRNVDIKAASNEQVVRVVNTLVEVLNMKAGIVAEALQRHRDESYLWFREAFDPKSPNHDIVLKWFRRANELESGMLPKKSASWIKEVTTNPSRLLLPLAREHVISWYASSEPKESAPAVDCALMALVTVCNVLVPFETFSDVLAD